MRPSKRALNELRKVSLELNYSKQAEGSCMVRFGDTHVLCTATVSSKLPGWLRGKGKGWVTAEYGMLPRSTDGRMDRESVKGKQSGRTQEIQRLIGRSLRAVVDLKKLGETQIILDCDVIQADGGTRTASITGAYVALYQACKHLEKIGALKESPIIDEVAAVSCGIYKGNLVLDLDYIEDSNAAADTNFVMTGNGGIVEVQATAEDKAFSEDEFLGLLKLARQGISDLTEIQRKAIESL